MEVHLLKCDETATILEISHSPVYQLMKRGVTPTVRIGNVVRVKPADLQKYIDNNVPQDNAMMGPLHRKV